MKNISHIKDTIKRKVLVVEDEFINQRILGNIISKQYEPIYASNGQEALQALEKNDHISLILLDLMMPVMDGFAFMEEVKKTPFSRIPIIVLTADKDAEIKSLKIGAQDFIVKPYDMPEIILARISRSIMLSEENEMIEKTARDSLTRLFTRKYFFEYIEEFDELNNNVNMDAICIDIKHFRFINDIYGRLIGDKVLISVADTIKGLFRENEGIASRISGDIFYLYIKHIDDYEGLLEFLLSKINSLNLKDYYIELRLAVYSSGDLSIPAQKRFDNALTALRILKNDPNENIKIYDNEIEQKEIYEENLLHEFNYALKDNQFKVYLQPKMDITGETPTLYGAEALVRWISPKYGFINPGVFIPLLEKNGLIYKLDQYIWNEVGKILKTWKDKYGDKYTISVNVSRIDILSPNFVDLVRKITKDNQIDPLHLSLEVTESAYSQKLSDIVSITEILSNDNHLIEIDDFGTGYSSLHFLTQIKFDILKIDMSFIKNMFNSEKDLKFVELIMNIAQLLNVKTVAEGVETVEQLIKLKELGCELVQGYYFSKPLPLEEFEDKFIK